MLSWLPICLSCAVLAVSCSLLSLSAEQPIDFCSYPTLLSQSMGIRLIPSAPCSLLNRCQAAAAASSPAFLVQSGLLVFFVALPLFLFLIISPFCSHAVCRKSRFPAEVVESLGCGTQCCCSLCLVLQGALAVSCSSCLLPLPQVALHASL